VLVGPEAADEVRLGVHQGALESIWWNRFGQNLRIKPNLVKFKFFNCDLIRL
jgi:hypothetical protein